MNFSYKLMAALSVLLLCFALTHAQTPVTPPPAYNTNVKLNFVRTWMPAIITSDTAYVNSSSRGIQEVKQVTEYSDGLGRRLQTVQKGMVLGTGAFKDLVTPVVYDQFGREVYQYLPYGADTVTGRFRLDPFNKQATFMNGIYGADFYYSKTDYEISPLNRVLKNMPAGSSWVGASRGVTHQYNYNTLNDSVRIWGLSGNTPITSARYVAGELVKDVLVDENGKKTIAFTDRAGLTVLTKTELTGNADGHAGWLCTYYVYDDWGRLRFIITPKAVALITTTWTLSSVILQELCFRYDYDERGRNISKHSPGTGSLEMVYDQRDRLIYSRDSALQTQGKWLVRFFDNQDRLTGTALYTSSSARSTLQTAINAASYAQLATTFPVIAAVDITPLSYYYYDDYSYALKINGNASYLSVPVAEGYNNAQVASGFSLATRGLPTGRSFKILGTSTWLTSTVYYDDFARPIQVVSETLGGGKNYTTILYDFNGKELSTYLKHTRTSSPTGSVTGLLTSTQYDTLARVKRIYKTLEVDGVLGTKKLLTERIYDERGNLKQRSLGALETLQYDYNIRGWILGANRSFVNGTAGHYFGYDLGYDNAVSAVTGANYSSVQYNGNIAGTIWKGVLNNVVRKYDFNYDASNRFLRANFLQKDGSVWSNSTMDFSVTMGDGISPLSAYDANGNIKSMTQKGRKGAANATIDQLTYGYKDGDVSNRLRYVYDNVNDITSTLGDFNEPTANHTTNAANPTTDSDYEYDGNGNMLSDKNNGVSSITYNYLNLPELIRIPGKGMIAYQYDAAGRRLKKTVTDSTVATPVINTFDYIEGFVYQNGQLQFLPHEEGRIRAVYQTGQPNKYYYDYFVKDHLGNIRQTLTEQTDFSMYSATMETEADPVETALFSNITSSRTTSPSGYPEGASSGKHVARLNGNNPARRIGPSLVLKVMPGDTFSIGTKAFYKSIGSPQNKQNAFASDMTAALISVFGGRSQQGGEHSSSPVGTNTPFGNASNLEEFQQLRDRDPINKLSSNKPRAYLNFVLFDEDFKLVRENSGVRQVQETPDAIQTLAIDKMVAKSSGYLYVYTSNETPQDVFFDDLVISLITGPVLEETHYYPFGLNMSALSSVALDNKVVNRHKFNGIRQNVDLGVHFYEADYRTYSAQIGRWLQVDPKSHSYPDFSHYSHVMNMPTGMSDPYGDDTVRVNDLWNVWEDFDTENDIVRLNGIKVTPSGGAVDISDPFGFGVTWGFDYKVMPSISWWSGLFNQRRYGGVWVDRHGNLTGIRGVRMGAPMDLPIGTSGVNVVKVGNTLRNVITTFKWSSKSVSMAAKALKSGATEVWVASRAEAEELYLALYHGQGYRNTTGMSATEAKNFFGKKYVYHWDDVVDETGRLVNHAADNAHGAAKHLQIHDENGDVLRIFFE